MGDGMSKKSESDRGAGLQADLRKFLKTVGITSQLKIEEAISAAVEAGKIDTDSAVRARMTLELPELGVTHVIEEDLSPGQK
jgi:hypothetical protein